MNSPGRRDLHKTSLDSISDLYYLGKGSFGSVVLGKWKGKDTSVEIGITFAFKKE